MKKFLNKAKDAIDSRRNPSNANQASQPQVPIQNEGPSTIQPPSQTDVIRYRYHHGANIGTVFILERWLCGSMFPEQAPGSSELAAVTAWVNQEGPDKARERFEKHWREYVSDADLDWLRDAGKCTTVRLPIGYFTLGPPYCGGTAFAPVATVYQDAWSAVKLLIQRCSQRGIGVLIDLHGLPGGANAQDHSGTNSGKAEFWGSRQNQDLATRCLCFIAQQVRNTDGVAGLQIINEAEGNATGMYEWYDSVIQQVSSIDPTLPIYVSDAWDLSKAVQWSQSRNSLSNSLNPIVIDTHLYWCFSDADKAKTPQQIAHEADTSSLSALDGKDGSVTDRGAAQAIVGEYSCVLDESSWAKAQGTPKDQLVHDFGNAESRRFQSRAGGAFFWTYRMDWMDGGEWGFKQMTNQGAIFPPHSLTIPKAEVQQRLQTAHDQRSQRRETSVTSHKNYWDTKFPGTYEHWRFEQGWDVGYDDALAFFGMRSVQQGVDGGDVIGLLDLWCLKRLRESGQAGSKFAWEFEQGLRQGVAGAREALGM